MYLCLMQAYVCQTITFESIDMKFIIIIIIITRLVTHVVIHKVKNRKCESSYFHIRCNL